MSIANPLEVAFLVLASSAVVLTPAAALAQNGYPARETLLDCRLMPLAEQARPASSAQVEPRRIGILLSSSPQGADGAFAYRARGIRTDRDTSMVRSNWPHALVIEEYGSRRGIHQERLGRSETSLQIDRIDEERRRAEVTLVENEHDGSGRVTHEAATGSCRLVSGPSARRAFEGFAE